MYFWPLKYTTPRVNYTRSVMVENSINSPYFEDPGHWLGLGLGLGVGLELGLGFGLGLVLGLGLGLGLGPRPGPRSSKYREFNEFSTITLLV